MAPRQTTTLFQQVFFTMAPFFGPEEKARALQLDSSVPCSAANQLWGPG